MFTACVNGDGVTDLIFYSFARILMNLYQLQGLLSLSLLAIRILLAYAI
jgi:hypothetical protein